MRILELVESLDNLMKVANIKKKDTRVLLLAEDTTDPELVQALATMIKQKTTDLSILQIKPSAFATTVEPSKVVLGAMREAELVISLITYGMLYSKTTATAAFENGTNFIELTGMASWDTIAGPTARWPTELAGFIAMRLMDKFFASKEIRITEPRGTDIVAKMPAGGQYLAYGRDGRNEPMGCGDFRLWPYGEIPFWPEETADGTVYFDGVYGLGYAEPPIKCTIKDGWVTKVQGDFSAKMMRNMMKQYRYSDHCSEVALGFNPKARLDLGNPTLIETQRNAGVAHLGFGSARAFGAPIDKPEFNSRVHFDATILRPTFYLDDEVLIKDGEPMWLQDPEILEFAESLGKGKELLEYERHVFR